MLERDITVYVKEEKLSLLFIGYIKLPFCDHIKMYNLEQGLSTFWAVVQLRTQKSIHKYKKNKGEVN